MTAPVKIGDTIRFIIDTHKLVDDSLVNADSTPVVVVLEQGTAVLVVATGLAYVPTVTNKATGIYEVAIVCSTANGFDPNKEYTSYVTATIGGVNTGGALADFHTIPTTGIEVNVISWNGFQAPAAPDAEAEGDVWPRYFKQSESTAVRRRVYFRCLSRSSGGWWLSQNLASEGASTVAAMLIPRISLNGAADVFGAGTCGEVNATYAPGYFYYEFTAAELATPGTIVMNVGGSGSSGTPKGRSFVVQCVPQDVYDGVRNGLTALPNAAAEAAGGLYTRGTGAGQINQPANGMVDVNAVRHLGSAYAAVTVAGVPKVDPSHWNGTAVATPTTAGVPRVDVKAMEASVVTATAIATGAITSAKFATDAINAAALATDAVTEIQTGLATSANVTTINTKLDTIAGYVDTEVAAIKAKTDNLPSDPASASTIATAFTGVNTKLDTIDDYVDTEVAAIKAKTDNLPSDPASASTIATAFTGVNTKLDGIKVNTDTLPVVLALLHNNGRLDNTTYNANGLMVAARLRVFSSAAAAAAATTGAADNADGEIFRFTITAVDEGVGNPGKVLSYQLVRAL